MDLDTKNLKKDQSISKEQAITLSLELARKGKGRVEPNPCVGAVLFDESESKLVSWGYHEFYGGPHAEVNCLKDIEDASGLSLVVSLEPCSHYGKTPPCADLLIAKKVSKLIYIEEDPNPQVSGHGLKRIQEAGIKVEKAPEAFKKEHDLLNDKFLYSFKNKESFVHLKWAQSANAKLGYKEQSTQVTSFESQMDAHFLRAQSQMIVVGLETVLQDDPRLNVRLKGFEKDLMVGVLDPDLKFLDSLKDKNLFKVRPEKKVFLITTKEDRKEGVINASENTSGQIDLNDLRKIVFKDYGVQSLFVEGGARTLRSFIEQKAFNHVTVYESSKELLGSSTLQIFDTEEERDSFYGSLVKVSQEKIGLDCKKDYIVKP